MHWLTRLFRKEQAEKQLDAELRFHLEKQISDYIASGLTTEEARRHAQLDFGSLESIKQQTRESHRGNFLDALWQDAVFGTRVLRKNRSFTVIAVLTLALGIGANTTIFSLINAVMLRTLPIHDPQHLLLLRWDALHEPDTVASYFWGGCPNVSDDPDKHTPGGCTFSYPMFEQIRLSQDIFAGAAAFTGSNETHVSIDGHVSMAKVQLVSGTFFSILGMPISVGRSFSPTDDLPGAPHAATMSYTYWQTRFGGDSSIVGKSILLDNTPFTITGVAAPKFSGLDPGLPVDMWAPISSQDVLAPHFPKRTAEKSLWVQIIARLKPEVPIAKAESAVTVIFATGVTSGSAAIFKPGDSPRLQLFNAAHGLVSLHRAFSQPLYVLMAAVGIILLIACANVAGLSISRAMAREMEMAVRFSLGATRARIVRQLLTEGFLLATPAAALGIVLANWSSSLLATFLAANWYEPLRLDVRPDGIVLGFTIAITVFTALLFGLAPAFHCMHFAFIPSIKGGGKTIHSARNGTGRRFSFGSGLVVAQVGLSIVVLAGAGLLVRTLVNLETLNVGFDARNVLLFYMDPTLTSYKGERAPMLYRELQDHLSALPGVTSASYSMVPLLSGGGMDTQYAQQNAPDTAFSSDVLPVGPHFFETMHIPLLAGRTFVAADFDKNAQPVPVVINESLAKRLFGKEDAVGREFIEPEPESNTHDIVLGVVGDAKYTGVRREIRPTAYVPLNQGFIQFGAEFELRTSGDPLALVSTVRTTLSNADANILISHLQTQTGQIDQALYQERLVASLSSVFGTLALLLACIGIYGLLSYEVTRRTREIGIRIALGAQQHEIRRLVASRGLLLTLAGAAIGVAGAAAVTRYLQTLLYGVKPLDPWIFMGAVGLLALVALLACYSPARRATRVDPMVALRYE
jgi:macrolide transport system ATP-binding/permease protein